MRLIDADELNGHACEMDQANGVELETIMMVPLSVINKAPTIDIETQLLGAELHGMKIGYKDAQKKLTRPQGKWIFDGCTTYCSECGYKPTLGGDNYCPNCGAKMTKDTKQ